MDLRLREITWVRLLSLLLWTLLVMLKKAITQLIEVVERGVFDVGTPMAGKSDQEKSEKKATLLPPLSDELVLSRIWPLMHQRVNVSLLWRLRRVNKAWKREVGDSLEWAALDIVRLDTPGLIRYLKRTSELRPSLRDRVESELKSLAVLLCEHLSDFVPSQESTSFEADRIEMSETGENGSRDGSSSRSGTNSVAGNRGCVCSWINYTGFENFQGRRGNEYNWSEEEEIEAYASSSESSMRAHYPRHVVRF